VIQWIINTISSVDELVAILVAKGGHVDNYYLREWNRNKHALVYLKGWFSGNNIREALNKALY